MDASLTFYYYQQFCEVDVVPTLQIRKLEACSKSHNWINKSFGRMALKTTYGLYLRSAEQKEKDKNEAPKCLSHISHIPKHSGFRS